MSQRPSPWPEPAARTTQETFFPALHGPGRQVSPLSKCWISETVPHTQTKGTSGAGRAGVYEIRATRSKHRKAMQPVPTSVPEAGIPGPAARGANSAPGRGPARPSTCWCPGRAGPGQRGRQTRPRRAQLIGQGAGPPPPQPRPDPTRRECSRGPAPAGASPAAAPSPGGWRRRPGGPGKRPRAEEEAGGLRGAGRRPEGREALPRRTPLTGP